MDTDQRKINQITDGSITKALMLFFFPILFGTFFQQLYNTADAIIVGQFVSKEALAAVGGTTGTLINLLVGFFTGLSSGASVLIAQYYGGKKEKELSDSVHTAIALALVGGLLLMVLGITLAPTLIRTMGTPKEILNYSLTYIRIYFMGMIPNLIYNMGSSILRATGDSKHPLYYLIICTFSNIVLDLLFVVVFHWAIFGVAIATVISQVISASLIFRRLLTTKDSYQLHPKKIHFDSYILKRIFYLGLPAGFQSSMYAISNVIIQSFVNDYGTDMIAAWTAYSKIDSIFWMTIGALGISIAAFVGQNYGAHKMDRIHRCVKLSLFLAFGGTAVISAVLYFAAPLLFRLFNDDPNVIQNGMVILKNLVPFYITYVTIEVLASTLRGSGISIVPMIIVCFGICGLRILWLYISTPIWPGIKTLLASYPISWTVTTILFFIYYQYKKRKIYQIA